MIARTITAKNVRKGNILRINRKPMIVESVDRRTNLTRDTVRLTFDTGVTAYYDGEDPVRLIGHEFGPL